ncbi:MAG: hypothetical protein JWM90_211 [Thermoleophilia bacterium]|nr:hypothetical protein [Thermoleophilia bacterium]
MSVAGDTAILVPFPQLDAVIERWLGAADEPGLPAHVTVLYPFRPFGEIIEHDLDRIRRITADEPLEPVTFARCGRFPEVVYLDPQPGERFRRLTTTLADAFPDCPPYGGVFDDIVPHLTVSGGTASRLDEIEGELDQYLPITVEPDSVWLMHFDGLVWRCELRAPFGGDVSPGR